MKTNNNNNNNNNHLIKVVLVISKAAVLVEQVERVNLYNSNSKNNNRTHNNLDISYHLNKCSRIKLINFNKTLNKWVIIRICSNNKMFHNNLQIMILMFRYQAINNFNNKCLNNLHHNKCLNNLPHNKCLSSSSSNNNIHKCQIFKISNNKLSPISSLLNLTNKCHSNKQIFKCLNNNIKINSNNQNFNYLNSSNNKTLNYHKI